MRFEPETSLRKILDIYRLCWMPLVHDLLFCGSNIWCIWLHRAQLYPSPRKQFHWPCAIKNKRWSGTCSNKTSLPLYKTQGTTNEGFIDWRSDIKEHGSGSSVKNCDNIPFNLKEETNTLDLELRLLTSALASFLNLLCDLRHDVYIFRTFSSCNFRVEALRKWKW